ncbi:MAG: terminase small subunit [Betaproteobacteria bacterium]|nr:terminase small subunit [Betaproteobacteria bacterium]
MTKPQTSKTPPEPIKAKRAVLSKQPKAAEKERRFIEAYISNQQNGAQAAITAGYAAKTARQAASRLLKKSDVRAEIERRLEEVRVAAEERTGVSVSGTLVELRALLHSDLRRAFDPKSGAILPPELWPDDLARAMCSVKVVEKMVVEGKGKKRTVKMVPMYVREIKLWDKGAAMERAMKHLGMFKQDNAQRGDAAIRALLEAVNERSSGFEVKR